MNLRKRLYYILEPKQKGNFLERMFEIILISIISLNIIAIVLESVDYIYADYKAFFDYFELFSIFFFTTEYIARLYSIVENPHYRHPITGRLRFAITPLAVVDLLAFLPFYISLFGSLRFLRIFRLMALFRIFKIARYMHALSIFQKVLRDRKEQLVLSFLFILFILMVISFFMFYAEHEAQPAEFTSIPATMWWGVATLTTVGYGDMVPITPLGKFLGGLFAVAGVGLLALPAGILSSGFFELLHNDKGKEEEKEKKYCPHCGEKIHD
jgi:voltage-gated potassium channel